MFGFHINGRFKSIFFVQLTEIDAGIFVYRFDGSRIEFVVNGIQSIIQFDFVVQIVF